VAFNYFLSKKPSSFSAIVAGIGIIGFGLLYFCTGIFPNRSGFSPRWNAVTRSEEPLRFGFALFVTFVIVAACLIWGLLKIKR
jgi:hypothetical protein